MTRVSPLRKSHQDAGHGGGRGHRRGVPSCWLPDARRKRRRPPQSPRGPLKIEGAKTHPTVFVTPADIARARDNIRRFDWASRPPTPVLREADAWLAKDDAWLRSVVPAPGAAFAYGIVACPSAARTGAPSPARARRSTTPATSPARTVTPCPMRTTRTAAPATSAPTGASTTSSAATTPGPLRR